MQVAKYEMVQQAEDSLHRQVLCTHVTKAVVNAVNAKRADLTGRRPRRRRGHRALSRAAGGAAPSRRLLLLRAAQVEQGAGYALLRKSHIHVVDRSRT